MADLMETESQFDQATEKRSIYTIVFSWCVAIGVLIAVILVLSCDLGDKGIIILLPIAYAGCFFGFLPNRRYLDSICLSVINIVAVFRYILYPILIALTIERGGFYSFDRSIIWILLYEMVGVYCIIGLFAHKIGRAEKNRFENNVSIGIPNTALIAALVPIFIMFPSLLTRFTIGSGVAGLSSMIGSVEVVLTMGIWALFVFLITRVASMEKYRMLGLIWVVAISVYYVAFNAISGDDVKRWQIIACGLAMLYIAINLFSERKRIIVLFGVIGIVASIILGSMVKFGISGSVDSVIKEFFDIHHFTEYFGGMKNISSAMRVFSNHEGIHELRSLLTDLFSGVPVLSSLFNYNQDSVVALYQRSVGRTDIICPLTAQSVAYFGVIGAPALGMLMTYLAIVFNGMLNRTRSYYCAYVLIELSVWFSLFMALNTTIIMGKLWIRLIFLVLQRIDGMVTIKLKWGDEA